MTTSKKKKAARVVATKLTKPSAVTPATLAPRPFVQVISIISTRSYDAEKMLSWIAQNEPELFLCAHKATAVTVSQEWARDTIRHLVSGNKVTSIKTLRERTGLGLKESKDICDKMHELLPSLGFNNVIPSSWPTVTIPAGANTAALQELIAAAKTLSPRAQ